MKRWIVPVAAVMIGVAAVAPTFAQSQQTDTQNGNGTTTSQPGQPPMPGGGMPGNGMGRGDGMGRGAGFGIIGCSTTTATDTVATALGMTASELRVALVSGKTVSDLATEKKVDLQTIVDALQAQRQADLDQALSDGLITQEQYDAITAAQANAPQLNGNTAQINIRVPAYNVADREAAAAEALGMTCAELVKAGQSGKSISEIASDQGVEVQTVIDAVVKAYEDAAAQDVAEGLITQAQADGRLNNLETEIGQWVYSAHQGRMDDFGGRGNGDMNGNGMRGNGNGQRGNGGNGQPGAPVDPQGQNNTQPNQPQATPTTQPG